MAETAEPRTIPQNLEAEQALLGALLVYNDGVSMIRDIVRPEDFYIPVHGRIFEAIAVHNDRGLSSTPVNLMNYFRSENVLVDVGGIKYLARLAASAVTITAIKDYATEIADCAMRRKILAYCDDLASEASAWQPNRNAQSVMADAQNRLFAIYSGTNHGGPVSLKAAVADAIEAANRAYRDGTPPGVKTGLCDVDRIIGALYCGDLVVVAGRPSMGKTAFATTIAGNAARDDKRVLVFSLEMDSRSIAQRELSRVTAIPVSRLRSGDLTQSDFDRIVAAAGKIDSLPLVIDDSAALTPEVIRSRAKIEHKRGGGIDMVIVDYLQLIRTAGTRRSDTRTLEIGQITGALKALALELSVPVVLLSQLSRAVESRDNKVPGLADLRDSGTIEQDADVVMFLYHEEYYLRQREPSDPERMERHQQAIDACAGKAKVIVAKQRNGPTGNIGLLFDPNRVAFADVP